MATTFEREASFTENCNFVSARSKTRKSTTLRPHSFLSENGRHARARSKFSLKISISPRREANFHYFGAVWGYHVFPELAATLEREAKNENPQRAHDAMAPNAFPLRLPLLSSHFVRMRVRTPAGEENGTLETKVSALPVILHQP